MMIMKRGLVLRGTKITCFIVLVLIAYLGIPSAVLKDPAMKGVREYDPLQHSHLVLRGIVASVSYETKSGTEWGFGSGEMLLPTAKVEISVAQVLKEQFAPRTLVGYAFWSERRFVPKEEYIFCIKWQDTKSGRVAWIGELPGLYAKSGDEWVQCEPFPEPDTEAESLTMTQVNERIRQASLASVIDSSDVAARGVVDSVWTSKYNVSGQRVGVLEHRRLRVTSWFKGGPGTHVEFVVPVVGASFVPKWYRKIPKGITRGTECFVFLKQGGRGLYPFGGPNSVLGVKGTSLVYDGRTPYRLSVDEATKAIRAEVRRELN